MRRPLETALLSMGAAMVLCSPSARADIYRWDDKDGVIHLTNRPRPGPGWKRVMRTGPGKASAVRGETQDRRPPRDRRPQRYREHDGHILEAAALYHIPVVLVRAVIHVESDFDPQVVSRAGAMGLMQLMPDVARSMGVTHAFDPRQNVFGGTRLLRILANQFDGDLVLTLAAYHAGAQAVKKYRGIPPFQTTQVYIRMVLARYYELRRKLQAAPSGDSSG